MNKEERLDYSTICISFALLVHVVVLCSLFLSFFPLYKQQDQLKNPLPSINTHLSPTLSAPVVLYSGTVTQPTQATTPQQPAQPQTSCTQESVSSNRQKTIAKTKELQKQEPLQESKPSPVEPLVGPIEAPTLFEAAPKPFDQPNQKDTGEVRKRQLTLSDLFKTMPHMMKQIAKSAQDGQELVIVQGDMKYYSFLKKFITHINQVFSFHGGPRKMIDWIQDGSIGKRAGISVTIDRQGNVLSRRLMHSCGHAPADELLVDAVDLASPFPPVPAHFGHKTVRVELVSVL